jgi:ABC-2 type transport system permease protein
MMDEGEASALIAIPEGFSAAVLEGRAATLEVVKNPAERFLPGVVEEGVGVAASVLSQGSRVFRPELDRIAAMDDRGDGPSLAEVTALTEAIYRRVDGVERYLLPPVISLETATVGEGESTAGAEVPILAYFLPGLSVMGVFFLAQAVTRDIQRDREAGLLRQLLTAPVSVADYLLGKCLSVLLVCVLGFAVLLGVGLAVGVTWGPPLALAAVVVATSLAVAGTMLLVVSVTRTERQADAVGTIVIMVWSMLGGAFVPLAAMPAFVRPLAATTPTFWGVDALSRLAVGGAGLVDILPNVAVLLAAGAALLAVGAVVLRRRISAGAV